MNKEIKNYKLVKKEKYEGKIIETKIEAKEDTIILALNSAFAGLSFAIFADSNTNIILRIINMGLGIINAYLSAFDLKNLIQTLNKKSMLESKIEDINDELEIADIEEKSNEKSLKLKKIIY